MALRASRSTSTKSLQSKFSSYAKSAETYQQAKMQNDYNNGLISSEDYRSYLLGLKKSITSNTSAGLSLQKKIDNVDQDIAENNLAMDIKLGRKDAADMVPVLQKRIIDNNIQKDTPAYNQIMETIIQYNDKSINDEKLRVANAYRQYAKVDAADADNQYLAYLQGLQGKFGSTVNNDSIKTELDNFKMVKAQNDINRGVNDAISQALRSGASTLEKQKVLVDAYQGAFNAAKDAGLNEMANNFLDKYVTASNSLQTAMVSSGNTEAKKMVNEEVQQNLDALHKADVSDPNSYAVLFNNYANSLMAKKNLMVKTGDTYGLDDVDRSLYSIGFDPEGNVLNASIQTKLVADGGNEIFKNIYAMSKPLDPENPQRDQYVLVQDGAKKEFKKITDVNADLQSGTASFKFEGSEDESGKQNYVVNPKNGIFYQVHTDTVKSQDGKQSNITYVNTGEVDANGNPVTAKVGMSNSGKDVTWLDQEVGKGTNVYRTKSEDGGWNYYKYTGNDDNTAISATDASEQAKVPMKDVLSGSDNATDKRLLTTVAANEVYSKNNKALNDFITQQGSEFARRYNEITSGAVNQIEALKASQDFDIQKAKQIQDQANAQINELQNSSVQLPKQVQDLRSALRATTGLPATSATGSGVTQQYKELQNFVTPTDLFMGKAPEWGDTADIGNGVIRTRSTDGGWNFAANGKPVTIDEAANLSKYGVDILAAGSKNPNDITKYKL